MTSSAALQPAPLDPHALRDDFPILAQTLHDGQPLVYLDNAASTQRPRQVLQTLIEVYEQSYSNVHRGIHTLSERATEQYEQARERVQRFIGAERPEEIVFTSGTTMAINLVARSWGDAELKAGDEILLSEMEHHSNLIPWQQLAERTGAVLRHVPITDDGRFSMEHFDQLLSERTRIIAVASVSNVLGTVNPIAEIARRGHAFGAIVLVDAAQSVPHLSTDVRQLDCDFLAFSGHKMLAPCGVGILYGKAALLERMPPFLGGGSMIREVTLDRFEPALPPAKFEAGTPPIAQAIALGSAIDYLQGVGLEAIHAHEIALTTRAHEVLTEIPGLKIHGPDLDHKAGIVSFSLDDLQPYDLATVVDRHGVAVRAGHHCAEPLHSRLGVAATTRASFYLYNTLEEVDQLAAAIVAAREFVVGGR